MAVALLILSPVSLIVLSGLAEYGDGTMLEISEAAAGLSGFAIFMFLVCAGVIMLIQIGMQRTSHGFSGLEEERLILDYGVAEKLKEEKDSFEGTYRNCTMTGIVLCILSVVPLVMAAFIMDGAEDNRSDLIYIFCTAVLLIMVAAAVYLLIWSGSIHGNYDKLLQQGDYTVEKKEQNRKTAFSRGYTGALSLPHIWESACISATGTDHGSSGRWPVCCLQPVWESSILSRRRKADEYAK